MHPLSKLLQHDLTPDSIIACPNFVDPSNGAREEIKVSDMSQAVQAFVAAGASKMHEVFGDSPRTTSEGKVIYCYSRRISMKPKPALEISLKLQQNGNFIEITSRPGDRDRGQRQTALKTRLNDRGAPRCEWHITTTPQMTTKTQTGRLAASFSFNNVRLICIQLRARRA